MDNGAIGLSRLSFTDLENSSPKLIVIDDVDGDGEFSIKRLLPELGAVIAKDYQRGAWYDGATFCERNKTAH
jgi:hypothetical protein